jgi:hypothetical protein
MSEIAFISALAFDFLAFPSSFLLSHHSLLNFSSGQPSTTKAFHDTNQPPEPEAQDDFQASTFVNSNTCICSTQLAINQLSGPTTRSSNHDLHGNHQKTREPLRNRRNPSRRHTPSNPLHQLTDDPRDLPVLHGDSNIQIQDDWVRTRGYLLLLGVAPVPRDCPEADEFQCPSTPQRSHVEYHAQVHTFRMP